jgi:hypothetical protein
MSWRDLVTEWVVNRNEHQLVILDLVRELIRSNLIPATLVDNATLHTILLRQALLEVLNTSVVPRAPQGNNFTYHMNAREEMMFSFGAKIGQDIKQLQEETGVHLDHYNKLQIKNTNVECC